MKAYKGFTPQPDGTMKCRDKTYVEGETYLEPTAEPCVSGMHACLAPLNVLAYYPPAGSVFHEVEVDDDAPTHSQDSKVASKRLTVGAQIGIPGLVKAQVEYVWSKATVEDGGHAKGDSGAASATGYSGAASATGDRGAASATGYRGAASATGDRGAASATGYSGAASATGDRGAASATGDRGAASATGDDSVAVAAGPNCRAMGAGGCVLFLIERDDDWHIIGHASVKVGATKHGIKIKPGAWYQLVGGRVVEAGAL